MYTTLYARLTNLDRPRRHRQSLGKAGPANPRMALALAPLGPAAA